MVPATMCPSPRLTVVADSHTPDPAFEDIPDEAARPTPGTDRVRFPLMRWVLAPCTTWQARRLASDFGDGMDARTAWVMARLIHHPEEHGFAMAHLDDECASVRRPEDR